jgi:hypothetical protein
VVKVVLRVVLVGEKLKVELRVVQKENHKEDLKYPNLV